jgi:transcriptional regulator NrdR family protein
MKCHFCEKNTLHVLESGRDPHEPMVLRLVCWCPKCLKKSVTWEPAPDALPGEIVPAVRTK